MRRCLGTGSCSDVVTRLQEPDCLDKKLKTALEALQISEWTGEQLKQIATEEQESVVNVVSTDRKYVQKGMTQRHIQGLELVHY